MDDFFELPFPMPHHSCAELETAARRIAGYALKNAAAHLRTRGAARAEEELRDAIVLLHNVVAYAAPKHEAADQAVTRSLADLSTVPHFAGFSGRGTVERARSHAREWQARLGDHANARTQNLARDYIETLKAKLAKIRGRQ